MKLTDVHVYMVFYYVYLMKKLLALFFIPFTCFAQQDTISSFNKFVSEMPGAMIRREFIEAGKFKNGTVQLYKLTNQRTNKDASFVKLRYSGALGSGIGGDVIIDMDELPGIIQAIEYLSKISLKQETENNEEYTYLTPTNIEVELHDGYGVYGRGWYISIGQKYYSINSYKPDQFILIRPSILDEAVPILKKSLEAKF